MIRIFSIVGISLLSLHSQQCNKQATAPECIVDLIEVAENNPVQSPPLSVFQYDYLGKNVYYISSPCCDQFNYVLDDHCEKICAPGGGFTGKGDGRCNDFFSVATGKTLIWQDEREQ